MKDASLVPVAPEFSRLIDVRTVDGRKVDLAALRDECAALAQRFGLVAVTSLTATVALVREGCVVTATGRCRAKIIQSCAISGEDLAVYIDEALLLRFVDVDTRPGQGDEIEIHADDCDEIGFTGSKFDLGEALAQSLALAVDPFATGADAETIRQSGLLGEEAPSPFAALSALKK